MSHYAKIVDNIVVKVIAAEAEFMETFVDDSPGEWIQTSYNTRGGKHYSYNSEGNYVYDGTPGLRKNYAGIGYTYDKIKDAFIPPKTYPSWILDETTCWWVAPIARPATTLQKNEYYDWNESILNWEIKTY